MSERTDRKLQEVAIARYSYRHDAEFAAGFLEDADIPYRLQLDDPGLGMSIGTMATIWVLEMDVRRAGEVLEVDGVPVSLTRRGSRTAESRPPPPRRRALESAPIRGTVPRRSEVERQGSRSHPTRGASLPSRERAIAILLSGTLLGAASLFLTEATPPIVRSGVAIASAGLALIGLTGRAPGPLGRFLHAIAGNAP
jgi:hypothetical protein